jgi:hypothetical protein
MNNQWTTQRGQLNQALDRERALRQARRRQQPSLWQTLGQGWTAARRWLAVWQRTPTPTTLRVSALR